MNSDMRDWTFRHYVANSLRLIPENKYIQPMLYEILNPRSEDTRTGDEIVLEVFERAGLHLDVPESEDKPTIEGDSR